ncbi:hypothetical protein FKP32DRAFT_1568240 [Trametes sanguinea]|nr:hypothetical protein FKP32DRAFT_1568240 [Trametes sanguinea]
MGKFYESIPDFLITWLEKQEVFWVATAPLSPEGHVNISPKGIRGSFRVGSPNRVWYQDLTGSGAETIAHIRENGRITLCFNAFEGPPRICRVFGRGTVYEFGTPEYDELIPMEERRPGSRAATVIDVHKVGTTCGYAVPFYEFKGHRQLLLDYFDKHERRDQADESAHAAKGLKAYWEEHNTRSIDGLPGMSLAYTVERKPDCFDEMRRAAVPEREGDPQPRGGTSSSHAAGNTGRHALGNGVMLKQRVDRQRMHDCVFAFAVGLVVAMIYMQMVR